MHNYRLQSKSNITNTNNNTNNNNKYNNINSSKNLDTLKKKHQQEEDSKQTQNKVEKKRNKIQQSININMTSQRYTSMHIKYLGNHSMWKKTTFQTRYNDKRLQFVDPNYFINKYVLDIGCNEGFLDIEIAMRFSPKQIYAIDIDHKLIKNARKTLYNIVKRNINYQKLANDNGEELKKMKILQCNGDQQQERQQHVADDCKKQTQLQFQQISSKHNHNNQEDENDKQIVCKNIRDLPLFFQDRLKNSFTLDHYLPPNVKIFSQEILKPENTFPLNIKFEAQNIYTIKYQQDKLYYDTIVCLKITKWIHLTFGDDGIRKLFQKIYDLLRLDGILILQTQDWASYKRKKNMHPLYRENYQRICYGPNEFQSILVNDPLKDFKFELIQKIDDNQKKHKDNKKLDYPILIFKKKSTMLYY